MRFDTGNQVRRLTPGRMAKITLAFHCRVPTGSKELNKHFCLFLVSLKIAPRTPTDPFHLFEKDFFAIITKEKNIYIKETCLMSLLPRNKSSMELVQELPSP